MRGFEEIQNIAKQFDDATINKDSAKLKELIDRVEHDVENHNALYRTAIYYSLATATSDLWRLDHGENSICDKETLQKQLYFYRKAIDLFNNDSLNKTLDDGYTITLMANVYINYGNTLEACGRKLLAIEQYYRALSVYYKHPMALGNLGSSLLHYAMFLSPNKAYVRDCMNYYAIRMLEAAINSNDGNIYAEAKEFFVHRLNGLSVEYKDFLRKDIKFRKVKKMHKEERKYRKWCIENGLYLTPLSDLPCNNLSFAVDEMCLPQIVTSASEGMPVIIGMFNQLKQEYVSSRYIYYETFKLSNRPHFSDKNTAITDTLEYALFSLRIEKIKVSFKTLFGILDKIAYLLNIYFDLGIKQADVTFTSVWQSKKFGKNGYEYKHTLDTSNNFALSSLYWIQRDFERSNDRYASPELRRLKDVRNFLEHKYTIVTLFEKESSRDEKNDVALYITENELCSLTFKLLKLVREAIICIALCVNVEETAKIQKLGLSPDKVLSVPMIVYELEDEFKI